MVRDKNRSDKSKLNNETITFEQIEKDIYNILTELKKCIDQTAYSRTYRIRMKGDEHHTCFRTMNDDS